MYSYCRCRTKVLSPSSGRRFRGGGRGSVLGFVDESYRSERFLACWRALFFVRFWAGSRLQTVTEFLLTSHSRGRQQHIFAGEGGGGGGVWGCTQFVRGRTKPPGAGGGAVRSVPLYVRNINFFLLVLNRAMSPSAKISGAYTNGQLGIRLYVT